MRLQDLPAALLDLSATHRRRQRAVIDSPQGVEVVVDGRSYLSFASNDYLGLADHPALVRAAQQGLERWGVGGGSSHLLAGHFSVQQEAEEALAEFVGQEAALLFGSGYAANLAIVSSLLDRGDAVFADRLNHASLNDACRLSRAEFKRFHHNDLAQLERLLAESDAKTKLIAVESVYSMDGDEAPLAALLALAER
ncbi:8-amino-7-oxononanoate synthase, partial [Pseudomonas sp. MWU13-2860]